VTECFVNQISRHPVTGAIARKMATDAVQSGRLYASRIDLTQRSLTAAAVPHGASHGRACQTSTLDQVLLAA